MTDRPRCSSGAQARIGRGGWPTPRGIRTVARSAPGRGERGAGQRGRAVRTSGGPAWRVVEGGGFTLSPDGRYAVAARNGQIYRVSVSNGGPKTTMDTGGVPFIKVWGSNGSPQWSPDGSK